jgi:iron(III) transport system substrate-binding protein
MVYTALDSDFSAPIFGAFEHATGTRVLPKFDVESTKTVGLVNALFAERERPRCDVFWNNEVLNTIRLQKAGLLEPYSPPMAQGYPERYRSGDGSWHGFAARARVLLVNTELVAIDNRPTSIHDLLHEKWRGKFAIAKPLFGTTATHAACLFATLGDEKAEAFFRGLRANGVQVLAGNKQVARAVATGEIAIGLTDTDDAILEVERGQPVTIVYPDRGVEQMGTLFIPNTLAIIKNCRHPQAARDLVAYLLTPQVEAQLAVSPSAQIPLHPDVNVKLRVETPRTVHAMDVDFELAAAKWDRAAEFLRTEFTGAN